MLQGWKVSYRIQINIATVGLRKLHLQDHTCKQQKYWASLIFACFCTVLLTGFHHNLFTGKNPKERIIFSLFKLKCAIKLALNCNLHSKKLHEKQEFYKQGEILHTFYNILFSIHNIDLLIQSTQYCNVKSMAFLASKCIENNHYFQNASQHRKSKKKYLFHKFFGQKRHYHSFA